MGCPLPAVFYSDQSALTYRCRKMYYAIFFQSDNTFDIINRKKSHKIGDKITVRKHPGLVIGVFGKL